MTPLQVGDGVSQDFHLAKRYFDQAAQVDNKAKIPRDIALVLLEVLLANVVCVISSA